MRILDIIALSGRYSPGDRVQIIAKNYTSYDVKLSVATGTVKNVYHNQIKNMGCYYLLGVVVDQLGYHMFYDTEVIFLPSGIKT